MDAYALFISLHPSGSQATTILGNQTSISLSVFDLGGEPLVTSRHPKSLVAAASGFCFAWAGVAMDEKVPCSICFEESWFPAVQFLKLVVVRSSRCLVFLSWLLGFQLV